MAEGPVPDECLLLAELDVTVVSGVVQAPEDVTVNERCRPFLIHLGLLQQMLLCGPKSAGVPGLQGPAGPDGAPGKNGVDGAPGKNGATGAPGKNAAAGAPGKDGIDGAPGKDGAPGTNFVVAAGIVDQRGGITSFYGDLTANQRTAYIWELSFKGYSADGQYVVKGTPLTNSTEGLPLYTFEVYSGTAFSPQSGIHVKVVSTDGKTMALGFMVEISEYPSIRQLPRPLPGPLPIPGPVIG